ncbi:type VII secretion integral membrane protein EccD [Kitasatospora sp. MAP12-15]|uniref:EsaB/YukD family protein n=1 Tax=unclassified Kitasatospora TaxID=2633591 RepID=UPI002474C0AC|nr:EsaB/YukD family protein [Kitasatospora sp. MAP12-44]MDH6109452.1 type VII secretion integral membrane protein EccD [Kitasatospora sp. MAP12-44]
MADEYCRITVVGDRRQLDLAVPAGAPITDYVDDLAKLCALEENDLMPPAWSLATGLRGPFPPERSLAELGIADGQVLYLRDLLTGELEEPLVLDVAEQVAQASGQFLDRPWNAVSRATTVLLSGLAWLVAAVLALAVAQPVPTAVPTAVVGAVAAAGGLLAPLLAWVARERRWSVPVAVRVLLALCSIPALAVAGWALVAVRWSPALTTGAHPAMTGDGLAAAAAAGGLLLGAALAYAAASGVTTLAVLVAAAIGACSAGLLAALRADADQCAAVLAIVAFLLLTAAPATAGRIVATAFRRRPDAGEGADEGEQVRAAVRTAMALLAAWGILLALVLGGSLVLLGGSRSVYGAAIAGCLGVALLLRAGSAKVVVEVVPGAAAGAAGLFALLLTGPTHLHWPGWTVPAALATVGLAMLGYGLRRLLRRDLRALPRPEWFATAGAVLGALSIPLMLAGFGVFGALVGMGRHL